MSTVIPATPTEPTEMQPLPTAEPCILVIFGGSGDLTRRKLLPAVFDLTSMGCCKRGFDIIGVGLPAMTDDEFRASMRQSVEMSNSARTFSEPNWQSFAGKLNYISGDLDAPATYTELAARLERMRAAGGSGNHLFYLSVPASIAPKVIAGLGAAGLNHNDNGWSRIVVEKPFGRDLETARILNKTVLGVFEESSVYRIDHYLGKETVQNILMFRFGNSLFEPLWNRNFIDYIEITAAEPLGIENRAKFYEETGALRDMVANHLLQLLSLTAMEPPFSLEADAVREQKVQVLKAIRPMTVEEVAQRTVRGQYGPGVLEGSMVRGYRQEPGVAEDSLAETFVALELHVDNWRWSGVPFFVRTGKRLAAQMTEIRVHFKPTPEALFIGTQNTSSQNHQPEPNIIRIRIQPDEGIAISFGAKRPGIGMIGITVKADFNYRDAFGMNTPVAYETLLLDVMMGDATLFTRGDEVEAEWRIVTPIEQAWAQLPKPQFPNYAAGSEGPELANALLSGGRHWNALRSLPR
jgi:glucose-6-phosphate 1-dehydrogenase